jgi:hypothetical protein
VGGCLAGREGEHFTMSRRIDRAERGCSGPGPNVRSDWLPNAEPERLGAALVAFGFPELGSATAEFAQPNRMATRTPAAPHRRDDEHRRRGVRGRLGSSRHAWEVRRAWKKWFSRRSWRAWMTWRAFAELLRRFP